MAIRAASISFAFTHPAEAACKPNSPKFSELPRLAVPRMRPFICLRNLTFLGLSIVCSPVR
jgi:hypothetical protein